MAQEQVITAREFLKVKDEESGTMWRENDDSIIEAFKEFAKLHVTAALNAACEKGDISCGPPCVVSSESILNAYSLENIK